MQLKLTKFGIIALLSVLFLWAAREVYLCGGLELAIEGPDSSSIAIRMSRREARWLEYFFQQILIREPFAYTLAGNKPVSIHGFENRLTIRSPSNTWFVLGWRTFEKYRRHFDSEEVDCWVENNWTEEGSKDLFVIADLKKLNEALNLDANFSIQSDISKLQTRKSLFAQGLQKHDALIGIALGYGKKNAWLYYDRFHDYANWTLEQKLDTSNKLPSIWDKGKAEKQAKKIWLKSLTFQSFTAEDIGFPCFVGDPYSEESLRLKQDYLMIRDEIIKYYKNRNFLEASLSLYKYGSSVLDMKKASTP